MERTHYEVINIQELLQLLNTAMEKSIKEYGHVETHKTLVREFVAGEKYPEQLQEVNVR